jgi:hypothetical protein
VQENQVGLKLNGTHQLLAYADYMNLLGDNIYTIYKNTETEIGASKKIDLWTQGGIVVKVLCYKPEGSGFETQ